MKSLDKKYRSSLLFYIVVWFIAVSLPVCSQQNKVPPTSLLPVNCSNSTRPAAPSSTTGSTDEDEGTATRLSAMTIDCIGVFCNTVLIIAILVDPFKVLRKGAWLTILNLAVADFIAAASNFLMIGLTKEFDQQINSNIYLILDIVRFFWMFGAGASFMFLALLTVETYVIIKYPIRSRLLLTSTKIALGCVVIWTLAVPLGLSNISYKIIGNSFKQVMRIYIVQIAVLELAVIVQVILKILIIREIMKSRNTEVLVMSSEQQRNNKHKEIAKTIVMLNVVLITTAFPYFVAKQMEYLYKLSLPDEDSLMRIFSNYYEPVALLNFAANPILYSLRLPDYRRTLLALFCQCRRKKRLPQRSSSLNGTAMTQRSRTSFREQGSTKL